MELKDFVGKIIKDIVNDNDEELTISFTDDTKLKIYIYEAESSWLKFTSFFWKQEEVKS